MTGGTAMSTATATWESVAIDSLEDSVYHYERILVAVDASRQSRFALRRAEDIARRSNARLDLLTSVVVPSTIYWSGVAQPMELNELYYADVLRAAAASVKDVPVTSYLVRGNAAVRILEHADKHNCGLIVMGCRGRGRAAAALLGSTSHAVLHAATVPVLIVRSDDAPDQTSVAASATSSSG
jgi:nucleotide-binding universal stress UspA family protein